MKPRFRAEWVVVREELLILASDFGKLFTETNEQKFSYEVGDLVGGNA